MQGPLQHLNVGKANPVQAFTGLESYKNLFPDIRHMKVVKLLSLRTGRLYHQEVLLGTEWIPGPYCGWKKNSKDTIGNRNRDLPSCCAVLQPAVPPLDAEGCIIIKLVSKNGRG